MDHFPRLIDANLRGYLQETLRRCHQNKTTLYVWTFNLGIFLAFVLLVGSVLYFRRRSKDVPEYIKEQQQLVEQNYVLSKIREYQNYEKRRRQETSMITDLPFTYDPNVGV